MCTHQSKRAHTPKDICGCTSNGLRAFVVIIQIFFLLLFLGFCYLTYLALERCLSILMAVFFFFLKDIRGEAEGMNNVNRSDVGSRAGLKLNKKIRQVEKA